jgi:hypothetical protein
VEKNKGKISTVHRLGTEPTFSVSFWTLSDVGWKSVFEEARGADSVASAEGNSLHRNFGGLDRQREPSGMEESHPLSYFRE